MLITRVRMRPGTAPPTRPTEESSSKRFMRQWVHTSVHEQANMCVPLPTWPSEDSSSSKRFMRQ